MHMNIYKPNSNTYLVGLLLLETRFNFFNDWTKVNTHSMSFVALPF